MFLKEIEQKLQKSQDHFSQQLKDIESKLQKPDTAAFEQQLKILENVSQQTSTVTIDTASKIHVVDEYRDMERRQWNLIIYNAPETESTDSTLRKSEDKKFLDTLINSIGADPVDIVNIVHLGAKSSGKFRPLRVQFANIEHRRTVLTNARKLHELPSSVFNKVYVNPDLSRKQRHTQWELRKELARKRKEERPAYLYGGAVYA